MRHVEAAHGVHLDPAEFHRAGYVTARFDVAGTAKLLTKIAAAAAAKNQHPVCCRCGGQLYVSTFADLADLGNPQALNTEHRILKQLAEGGRLDQRQALAAVEASDPLMGAGERTAGHRRRR